MANKSQWPHRKSLKKDFNGMEISLGFACDLLHGRCWMCRAMDWGVGQCGHGFSKNKFSAVRMAISDLAKEIQKEQNI